jgi:hypothetical protein
MLGGLHFLIFMGGVCAVLVIAMVLLDAAERRSN